MRSKRTVAITSEAATLPVVADVVHKTETPDQAPAVLKGNESCTGSLKDREPNALHTWATGLLDRLGDQIPSYNLAVLRQQTMELLANNTTASSVMVEIDPVKPLIVIDDDQLKVLAERVRNTDVVIIDIETSDLDPREGVIVGLGIAITDTTFYIPINHRFENGDLRPNQLPLAQVLATLQLENKPLIADNAKFELKWLQYHGGITCNFIWDTMLSARLLRSNLPADLKTVAERELDVPSWDLSKEEMKRMQFLPIDKVAAYCAKDCWYTRCLWLKQREVIQ
jgi:hypothetical protein